MNQNDDHLIWIDLEMTGLNTDQDHIIEIATIITDSKLDIIAEGPVFAIHQSNETLNKMDEWNKMHHGRSGLIKRIQESTTTKEEAEAETLLFLKQYVNEKKSPMCGNSICQDRRFLHREMPELEQFFHYQHLDVSSLKILAQRWAPEIAKQHQKITQHTALQDIHDSIDELRFYKKHLFNDTITNQ